MSVVSAVQSARPLYTAAANLAEGTRTLGLLARAGLTEGRAVGSARTLISDGAEVLRSLNTTGVGGTANRLEQLAARRLSAVSARELAETASQPMAQLLSLARTNGELARLGPVRIATQTGSRAMMGAVSMAQAAPLSRAVSSCGSAASQGFAS